MRRPPYPDLKPGDRVRVWHGAVTCMGEGTVERLYNGTALVLCQTKYGGTYRRFSLETGRTIGDAIGGCTWMPRLTIEPIEEG